MGKSYKRRMLWLGGSDYAALTLTGITKNGLESKILHFGEDGAYKAWLIDETIEVPSHYELQHSFECWVKIYDDDREMTYLRGDKIEIYRAGERGCLIRIIGGR